MNGQLVALDGLLLVDKPSGPTSYDVIRWAKPAVKKTKIGHCGTLDPLASGLLVLLIGRATKQQSLIMGNDKEYLCLMRLGLQTDSGDITGKIIQQSNVPALVKEDIENVFKSFLGEQSQVPPMFSALKKDGAPLYKLARQGEVVIREPRRVKIHALDLMDYSSPQEILFRVRCSSGTYVRTLVEDVGKKLGTVATVTQLCRESIGPYSLEAAFPAENLNAMGEEDFASALKPIG